MRLASRLFAHDPLFTIVAVLTLGFGIGANLAMFSVAHAVLWRPLPFRDADRLVEIHETRPGGGGTAVYTSMPNYTDWRASTRSFAEMAAHTDTSMTLTGRGNPVRLAAYQFSATLLPMLGVEPMPGRNFLAVDDRQNGTAAVLLSHHLWQERFGADPPPMPRGITPAPMCLALFGPNPSARRRFCPTRAHVPWVSPESEKPEPHASRADGHLELARAAQGAARRRIDHPMAARIVTARSAPAPAVPRAMLRPPPTG